MTPLQKMICKHALLVTYNVVTSPNTRSWWVVSFTPIRRWDQTEEGGSKDILLISVHIIECQKVIVKVKLVWTDQEARHISYMKSTKWLCIYLTLCEGHMRSLRDTQDIRRTYPHSQWHLHNRTRTRACVSTDKVWIDTRYNFLRYLETKLGSDYQKGKFILK